MQNKDKSSQICEKVKMLINYYAKRKEKNKLFAVQENSHQAEE